MIPFHVWGSLAGEAFTELVVVQSRAAHHVAVSKILCITFKGCTCHPQPWAYLTERLHSLFSDLSMEECSRLTHMLPSYRIQCKTVTCDGRRYYMMYQASPFEHALSATGGSLMLAVLAGIEAVHWPIKVSSRSFTQSARMALRSCFFNGGGSVSAPASADRPTELSST